MQNKSDVEGFRGVTDDALVRLAQQGSDRAFGELVLRHSRAMSQVASSILRDRQEAEDELQNAWSKAWRHLDGFEGGSRFTTWMTRIVINQCLMRLRQIRRARFLYVDAPPAGTEHACFALRDSAATPEQSTARRELDDLVRREIGLIPPLLRQALVLRELRELPMPQVARELGISLVAAKSRLLRARQELRSRLENRCGPFGSSGLMA